MTVFIHFFGLCTLGFILKLHFSISKVPIECRKTKTNPITCQLYYSAILKPN